MTETTLRYALVASLMTAALAGCTSQQPRSEPTATKEEPACGKTTLLASGEAARSVRPGRWVTMNQLESSLPKTPIDVGFDIDDTLVFPSPGFNAVLHNTDGPNGTNAYGADMRAVVSNPRSWQDIHTRFDQFSLPKEAGRQLLALHQKRGDRVHLVTARVGTQGEALEARIRKTFGVELAGPIAFTNMKSKTEILRSRNIKVYYGDSDSDIEYAVAAGARGVRVLRATNAIKYDKSPCFGKFGEDVIVDSDH